MFVCNIFKDVLDVDHNHIMDDKLLTQVTMMLVTNKAEFFCRETMLFVSTTLHMQLKSLSSACIFVQQFLIFFMIKNLSIINHY